MQVFPGRPSLQQSELALMAVWNYGVRIAWAQPNGKVGGGVLGEARPGHDARSAETSLRVGEFGFFGRAARVD
jgi:hypothetical protein